MVITGLFTLIDIVVLDSRSRTVMEVKIDAHAEKVGRHNQLVGRTHHLEEGLVVAQNDIETLHKRTKAEA